MNGSRDQFIADVAVKAIVDEATAAGAALRSRVSELDIHRTQIAETRRSIDVQLEKRDGAIALQLEEMRGELDKALRENGRRVAALEHKMKVRWAGKQTTILVFGILVGALMQYYGSPR